MKIIIILLFLLGGLLPVVQHGRFALSGFELSAQNSGNELPELSVCAHHFPDYMVSYSVTDCTETWNRCTQQTVCSTGEPIEALHCAPYIKQALGCTPPAPPPPPIPGGGGVITPPTPPTPPPPTPTPTTKTIIYAKNITHVSAKSQQVLTDLMDCAGINSLNITSTIRTPHSQANAMYNNCLSKGVASQKKLYSNTGDQVIETYSYYKNLGYSEDYIVNQMENKINSLGASNVSRHCGDPNTLNVIDISPSSISNADSFINCIGANTSISNYYTPKSNDPAIHIEIPQ